MALMTIVQDCPVRPETPPAAKPAARPSRARTRPRRRKRRKTPAGRLRAWREMAGRVWTRVNAIPASVLTIALLVVLAIGIVGANIIHWVIRKPTELLLPVSDALVKTPAATWASYGDLFRRYSTAAISPELLAALAQTESAGNPAAHTYWRWDVTAPDLFGIYRPASSSVGMFQMTEPAYDEARRFCVRRHVVVERRPGEAECDSRDMISRLIPAHSVELTAIYLDRSAGRLLGQPAGRSATARQKQDVAALIHLCGAGPAKGFVRRGFRLAPGERCGDHDPAAYLAQTDAMVRLFRKLAADHP
jgi:hypothetical protein